MKILYLINHAGKAGTEKYVRVLCESLHNRTAECHFVYNEAGLLCEQIAALGITPVWIEMKSPFDVAAAKKLADYCKLHSIDIIHAQYPRENYIAVLSKMFYKNVKVVFTAHLTNETSAVWKTTNAVVTQFVDAVISVCDAGRKVLIKNNFPAKKIAVIFNGVPYEPNALAARADTRAKMRAQRGISEGAFVMLIFARFSKEKGLDHLVNAISILKKTAIRDFCLIIAGDGAEFAAIRAQIDGLGLQNEIILTGFTQDTKTLAAGSDLYINSSIGGEALSFAILEGMSAGLPIVVTDVGGNAEIASQGVGVRLQEAGASQGVGVRLQETGGFEGGRSAGGRRQGLRAAAEDEPQISGTTAPLHSAQCTMHSAPNTCASSVGLVVPPADPSAMAQAMQKMMGDQELYDACSKNALHAIETVFNIDVIVAQTEEVYKGIRS